MEKYVLVAGLAVILLLGVTAAVVELDSQTRSLDQEQALEAASRDLESRFFHRRRPELEWLATQPSIRTALSTGKLESEELQSLLHHAQGLLGIEVVYLMTPDGRVVAASDPAFLGIDLLFRDYFRKGFAGLPAYSLAVGLVRKTPGLYASVPVFESGKVVGLLAFRTSAESLYHWQASHRGILILSPDGRVFASEDPAFPPHQEWTWAGSHRVKAGSHWYRVARYPLDVVPGFTVVSLVAEVWPWELILAVNLILVLVAISGFSLWRQMRIVRDRRTEVRDRQQREMLLSHLMEGIAVFDSETKLVWSNSVFEAMIQRSAQDPPPTMGELWDRSGPGPWRDVLEGRRPWVVFESVLRGSQGGWIPVSAGFTSAEGRYVLSVLDGTERYRSDQLLRQSQKLTVLGQLSGGIAHDLNNMLGVLMGMADLLKMSLPEQDPLQESVDLILTTLSRAAGLSEKMLAFARQTPMNRVSLDMAALLRELRFLSRTALPEGNRAEISVPDRPILVVGDENLLLSAFLNLILNASEAMPEGGLVRVTGECVGDRFMIVVEDEGRGMDKATLARIFEPFFSTKLDKKGTGLGLSLVRRTILEHRGTIDVQSVLGKGTRIAVSLPLAPASPSPMKP